MPPIPNIDILARILGVKCCRLVTPLLFDNLVAVRTEAFDQGTGTNPALIIVTSICNVVIRGPLVLMINTGLLLDKERDAL